MLRNKTFRKFARHFLLKSYFCRADMVDKGFYEILGKATLPQITFLNKIHKEIHTHYQGFTKEEIIPVIERLTERIK